MLLPLCFRLLQDAAENLGCNSIPRSRPFSSTLELPVCGGTMHVVERLSPVRLLLRSPHFPTFFCAMRRSYRLCRLSQNSAVVPKKCASRRVWHRPSSAACKTGRARGFASHQMTSRISMHAANPRTDEHIALLRDFTKNTAVLRHAVTSVMYWPRAIAGYNLNQSNGVLWGRSL